MWTCAVHFPALFPGCVLELTDQEVAEWLNPSDLLPGRKVLILGCTLHVCDCDEFTKTFYRKNFGITDLASTHGSVPPPAPRTKVSVDIAKEGLIPVLSSI